MKGWDRQYEWLNDSSWPTERDRADTSTCRSVSVNNIAERFRKSFVDYLTTFMPRMRIVQTNDAMHYDVSE